MRILILTAATGGGHDMRANAMSRWIDRLADWDVAIGRPLENGHGLYRFGVDLYNRIQRAAPRLHHVYFGFLELAGLHRRSRWLLKPDRFRTWIAADRPDVIISTHAHLNHGFFELARETLGRSNVRCVTYCGELGGGYGFSRHWVNPDADLFIGAVDETAEAAVALGMPEERTWAGGYMLFPEFYDGARNPGRPDEFIRAELGMDPDAFILLLAVGAAGANNHIEILNRLERRGEAIQVVALCGRDEGSYRTVASWGRRASAVTLKALRYRQDMSRLLRCASAVIARPGTGTVSEAIMSDCPLIMNGIGGIMPQESVTVRYGMRHGIARLIRRAGDVGMILDDWERSPRALVELRLRMRELRPFRHPREILERATGLPLSHVATDASEPRLRCNAR